MFGGTSTAPSNLGSTTVDSVASPALPSEHTSEINKDKALDAVGKYVVEDQRTPSTSRVFGGPFPAPSNLGNTTVDSAVSHSLPSEHASEINKDKAVEKDVPDKDVLKTHNDNTDSAAPPSPEVDLGKEKDALSCISQEIVLPHSGTSIAPSNLGSTTVASAVSPALPTEHASEINKDKAVEKDAPVKDVLKTHNDNTVSDSVPPPSPEVDHGKEKGVLSCISQEIVLPHSGDQSDADQFELDSEMEKLLCENLDETVLNF